MLALFGVARTGYHQLLLETIPDRPDAAAVMAKYSDRRFERWMDYESGRWSSPAPPPPTAGRRYHGANE